MFQKARQVLSEEQINELGERMEAEKQNQQRKMSAAGA
jgi:hypothetical protein